MTANDGFFLSPECLLSKWGFNDGDVGWDAPDDCWEVITRHDDAVLLELVRRYLLPRIRESVELVVMQTIHNPVRAHRVDGVDVTDRWCDTAAADAGILHGSGVRVHWSKVAEIAAEIEAAA